MKREPMKISVASGKGGTGKTTIAVNLALSIENSMLIDCDVEEPNCHLFFKRPMTKVKDIGIPVPKFDLDKCDRCGKCADFCQYNSIAVIKDKLLFFEELCHGCGGCKILCPQDAITIVERRADEYDEEAVQKHLEEQNPASAEKKPVVCSCPGSAVKELSRHSVCLTQFLLFSFRHRSIGNSKNT